MNEHQKKYVQSVEKHNQDVQKRIRALDAETLSALKSLLDVCDEIGSSAAEGVLHGYTPFSFVELVNLAQHANSVRMKITQKDVPDYGDDNG